jgi:hypothetical protein
MPRKTKSFLVFLFRVRSLSFVSGILPEIIEVVVASRDMLSAFSNFSSDDQSSQRSGKGVSQK